MMKRVFEAISIVVLVLLWPATTRAELHEGTGVLVPAGVPAGWDFSAEASVPPDSADVMMIYVVDPPPLRDIFTSINGTVFVALFEPYEEVTEAPEDSSQYFYEVLISPDVTYIAFTPEGHYAKFRLLDYWRTAIEYAYQDDGRRNLTPGSPIESSSWGRIKAAYHEGMRP
jgi:hypothetical protein